MAEGMEVDTTPVVRDKKRFEVKKVCLLDHILFLISPILLFNLQWNAVALWAWGMFNVCPC